MANTYSQISIHAVFAVKGRENLITSKWRDQLHQYIAGIVNSIGAKSLSVGGWKDHVHVFFGMPVVVSISDMVGKIKANSSRWINEQRFVQGTFQWQSGFGAFSHSRDERDRIFKYIMGQEEHHKINTFKKEYLKWLTDFEIEYDNKYLFEFYD